MKIALLTDGIYPYVIGGMQRHSFYLAKYLAAAGVKIDLYHMNESDRDISILEMFSDEEKANIRSFVVEFPDFGKSFGHYVRESYEYSKRIWNIFREQERPDFIIVKGFAGWELLNRKSKGESLPPVGINFHGFEMFQKQPGLVSWLKSRLLLRGPVLFNVKNADYLFSYGGKITGIIGQLGVQPERIIEIPAGIPEDWINDEVSGVSTPRKFIFIGRYERRKGVEELVKVLREWIRENRDFEFHFVGPIPEDKQIDSGKVIYHGMIAENQKIRQLLQQADVLVCPSHSEGMPNVILEALASGLAVIASDTGATSVMVNSSNGWLTSPGNVQSLKEAMNSAMKTSPEQLIGKKRSAVEFVKAHFLWKQIALRTLEMIGERIKV